MPEAISSSGYYPVRVSSTNGREELNNTTKVSLLIVDDYIVFREGLVSLLKQYDKINIIEQCSDTQDGIHTIEKTKPDIVIVDISMPGTSPFELAKRSRILSPQSKILFFIRDITDNNIERGLEAGASGFISKSESLDGILEAIGKANEGSKYFSEDIRNRIIAKHSYDPNYNAYTPRRSLLSPREIEVLCCVARGMKAKNIGKTLHITAKTVERHKSNIMAKLGLHSQVDLAIYAIKEGYISP